MSKPQLDNTLPNSSRDGPTRTLNMNYVAKSIRRKAKNVHGQTTRGRGKTKGIYIDRRLVVMVFAGPLSSTTSPFLSNRDL